MKFGIREAIFIVFVNLGVLKNILIVSVNVRIRENIFTISKFSETVYFFSLFLKLLETLYFVKKSLCASPGRGLYLLHKVDGLRWMRMAGSVEAD